MTRQEEIIAKLRELRTQRQASTLAAFSDLANDETLKDEQAQIDASNAAANVKMIDHQIVRYALELAAL